MNGFTFDYLNLIYNNDKGDTAAETGRYYTGLWLLKNIFYMNISGYAFNTELDFKAALEKLEIKDGIYVRHPDQEWRDPSDFSKDQQVPLEIAMCLYNKSHPELGFDMRLRRLKEKQKERFLHKYQNWDFPNASHEMISERALGNPAAFKIKYADSFLLGQSFIQSHFKTENDVADDLNHTIMCIHASIFRPNTISDRATNYYADHRRVQGAWNKYYHPSNASLYGMPSLYLPIINKFFS